MQFEDHALKSNARAFASRSKSKAKPHRREPVGSSSKNSFIGKRTWTDVEPVKYSFSDFEVSKKCIFFFIHNMCIEKKMEQSISGESKKIIRIIHHTLFIGLTASGKYAWQEEETREDSSIVLVLQKQLCMSELFRDLQDAVSCILLYRILS